MEGHGWADITLNGENPRSVLVIFFFNIKKNSVFIIRNFSDISPSLNSEDLHPEKRVTKCGSLKAMNISAWL